MHAMETRQKIDIALGLVGGIFLLTVTAHFVLRGDLTMGLFTGIAGIAALVLAGQEFARLRRP